MDNLEAWSFGSSIITFLLPMLAFVAVALALLVLYTKPEIIQGRKTAGNAPFPITATRMPGTPVEEEQAGEGGKTDESTGA